ncbi:hypothetical protein C8R45DRAFT_1086442 [Mycena sanguinolenta]|nr:hypothetical protein C8R45DRAFT_1086442 [Mycena sanguinolenta]
MDLEALRTRVENTRTPTAQPLGQRSAALAQSILNNIIVNARPMGSSSAGLCNSSPDSRDIAFPLYDRIKELEEPLKKQVQAAFADSMAVIRQVMIAVAGLGFLLTFVMPEIPMRTSVDENYALKEKELVPDAEKL